MRIRRHSITAGYPTDPAGSTPIRRQPLDLQPLGQILLRNGAMAHWSVPRRPSWISGARLPAWCRPNATAP
jgi:hypothetical protein